MKEKRQDMKWIIRRRNDLGVMAESTGSWMKAWKKERVVQSRQ